MSDAPEKPSSRNDRVAQVLSRVFGSEVRVIEAERLGAWAVARCRLAGEGPGLPTSVIVKWLRGDGTDQRRNPAQLHTECAALGFLADVDATLAPRLLAADLPSDDPGGGFLVLEDLGALEPLREVVLRDGAQLSRPRLADYAAAFGRLHAVTRGRTRIYYERRARLGPIDPGADVAHVLGQWRDGVRHTAHIGAAMDATAERELAGVVAAVSEPGPFLAFSNGDCGLNNFLVAPEGGGRVIDFEAAGFRHVVADVVGDFYLPGPMWLTLDDPVRNGMEAAYRKALAEAVPESTDDRVYGEAVAGGALLYALRRLATLPTMDARPVGDHSRLHRVATLEAAAGTAELRRSLPGLAGWARTAAALLRRRWPDADVDLAALGAYTPRGYV